jgi:host factor-I protein
MENRISLQDKFLTEARLQHMPLTVILTNGFQQRGVVERFDNYTVLLLNEGKQYMIYKHAISTLVPARVLQLE